MKKLVHGIMVASVAAALLAGVILAVGDCSDAGARARQAAADLETCRGIADRVSRLSAVSGADAGGGLDALGMQRRGEEALRSAGLPGTCLVQVAAEAPRAVGHTAYMEMPTDFVVRRVTLRQIIVFLLAMTGDRSPLEVKRLRLSAPHEERGDVQWEAEVRMAYLVYRPTAVNNLLLTTPEDDSR